MTVIRFSEFLIWSDKIWWVDLMDLMTWRNGIDWVEWRMDSDDGKKEKWKETKTQRMRQLFWFPRTRYPWWWDLSNGVTLPPAPADWFSSTQSTNCSDLFLFGAGLTEELVCNPFKTSFRTTASNPRAGFNWKIETGCKELIESTPAGGFRHQWTRKTSNAEWEEQNQMI